MLIDPVFFEGNITRNISVWPYQFRATHFDPYELRDWCIKNLTSRGWAIHDYWGTNLRGITINNKADAMAFKLTWV